MEPEVSVQWWQLSSQVTVTCSSGETRLHYLPCLQPLLLSRSSCVPWTLGGGHEFHLVFKVHRPWGY